MMVNATCRSKENKSEEKVEEGCLFAKTTRDCPCGARMSSLEGLQNINQRVDNAPEVTAAFGCMGGIKECVSANSK